MQYKKDIYLYLMSLTHNHTLSEDLLSETFVKAIISLPTFREQSSVKTWLFGIARNTWLQYLRKNKKVIEYDELLGAYIEISMEEGLITKEIIKRINELLQEKEERTRKIILMRVNGEPFSEIAERLNISENAARVIDFRTKQYLKGALKREGYL
jgi:RNA polymerase sigma-70 factor (ECF subfamily)